MNLKSFTSMLETTRPVVVRTIQQTNTGNVLFARPFHTLAQKLTVAQLIYAMPSASTSLIQGTVWIAPRSTEKMRLGLAVFKTNVIQKLKSSHL